MIRRVRMRGTCLTWTPERWSIHEITGHSLVPAYAARNERFAAAEGLDETKDLPARCASVRDQPCER